MKILNQHEVVEMVGLSKVTLWRLEKLGRFPVRLQLGARKMGWREDEIFEWIEKRPRGIAQRGTAAVAS